VTLISAPAGSGKTMLVSTWLNGGRDVAWVGVERDETDPIRFWAAVMDALRASGALAEDDPLATLTPAPAGGQDEFLARLLDGLDRLPREVLLVLDDLHELRSAAALRGVEQLLGAAPVQLRTIVISRREPKLALHRLRLAGDLLELRAADLHFTADEAGELLAGAGVAVNASDVSRLHERTEGWAAGLRLAALSLARHDAPARFVAEFSGSERTVADYLLDEVLASQPPEVRSLLLRTCILERVNGPLADLLTGRGDGARLLHELEEANAFVVAVDVARTWFRYHHLLADLLRLELQREAPETLVELHRLAAGWHAAHGRDWELAGELLGRHWVHLLLDGEDQTLGALLAALPAGRIDGDAELATIAAADMLAEARWAEADARIAAAQAALPELPQARRHRAETALASVELLRARRVGDLAEALEEATALLHGDGAPAGVELEAFALMNLGIIESWTLRLAEAERHCEAGLALARRLQRPYLELGCLTTLGTVGNLTRRLDAAEAHLREAIGIAERLGWSALPLVGVTNVNLAAVTLQRGQLEEAEQFLRRAGPILAEAPEPAASVGLCHCRGMLALAREEHAAAVGAFQEGERISDALRAPHFLVGVLRQWRLRALIRLGDLEPARAALPDATNEAQWCSLAGHLRLADGDAAGAIAALAPALDGPAFAFHPNQVIEALLLDAHARTRLGEREAAERSVERALDLAEAEGLAWIWLVVEGARDLLTAHPAHRTRHAAFARELADRLDGGGAPRELAEPLNERELTVLRFLPTNLSAAEIGSELFLSVNTVKTHMRKLYAKLDVHTRAEAVERGRALGLLARRG
jgi:LuxR family maltose regulon positive regulatory protein